MCRLFFTLLLLIWSQFSFSQKAYFQQHVDYTIDVALDDNSHILRGFETLIYKNNSTDTLKSIFIHLWPNAFKNDRTSYVEQDVENGDTKFYYSKEDDKGFIDSLGFKVNNETVNISNYNNHEDIILLELNEALLPGKSVEITTPFRVVIPYTFSRLGHVGQTYQISQWYPKPAVYDRYGWHPIPYLDQGEFYSEFGNYKVRITLPSNYVVAATGDLQEESEKQFITSRILKDPFDKFGQKDTTIVIKHTKDTKIVSSDTAIISSTQLKTISFIQSNVHDFAWFANKSFQVEKTEVTLASGRKVDCYSYFKPVNAVHYKGSSKTIGQTVSYLSEHVGEYPYNHASIVDGALSAGGGMEYPNITVIGDIGSISGLQTVIIHEVGHNWFYGLLGSNERDHPWMDEGINSFYEKVIKASVEKNVKTTNIEGRVDKLNNRLNTNFLYQCSAKENTDQTIELPSAMFTSFNYGGIVYQKTPMLFAYLKSYLGEQIFDKAMKRYFNEWHFKHPYPKDFKKIMNEESGKDLSWFFDDGFTSTKKIDFKIQSVSSRENITTVKAFSRTDFTGPIPINACMGDSIIQTKWIEYPYKDAAIFTNLPSGITAFKIDALHEIPEIKISNNNYKNRALFHRIQPAIKFGTGLGLSLKNELYLLPAVGYNYYDKLMLGGIIHNLRIPNNKFQFALIPMYSLGTKEFVGSGFISYSIFPKNRLQQITFAMQGRTYHQNESHLNISNSVYLRYIKFMPSVNIEFRKSTARSPITNQLLLKYSFIARQSFNFIFNAADSLYRPSGDNYTNTQFATAIFTHKNARTFNPYSYNMNAYGNRNFMKASLEANLRIDYFKKGKAFYIRFFGGKFFDFKNGLDAFAIRDQYLNETYTARNDFMYDQVYLARNEQKGFLSHQLSIREGGFKIQTTQLSNPIGQNDNWLTALNLRTDLPIKLPVKVQLFLDAGTYANAGTLNNSGNKAVFDGGVEVHLFGDMLIVYAPLLLSKDFKDYTKSTYSKNRALNTLSFSFNMDKINWFKTQRAINLFN